MKISIGEHLRNAREMANLKQVDVKNRTNISNKSISNWETNVSQPSVEDSIALADLYGISLDELFGHRTKTAEAVVGQLSTIEVRIVLKLRNLNNEGQLKALEYIDDLTGNIKYNEKEVTISA